MIQLDISAGTQVVTDMAANQGLSNDFVRLDWCGAAESGAGAAPDACSFDRGSVVTAEVQVWVPLVATPWGDVGGLWVGASHSGAGRSIPESPLRSERGSVTLWTLGLSLLLLLFGGLAVDFWRALALQRELAAIADSASVAAGSGIDEEHYRTTGEVLIDAARATGIGSSYVASQDVPSKTDLTTAPDGLSVSVLVVDRLELGLMGVFVDQRRR